tara:strand:+ start:176 stop:484 length:309 start_codon:yes stop_codon:yes gene_type:complete
MIDTRKCCECSHCGGTGFRDVVDNTHDVVYKEPCYCTLQHEREQKEMTKKIAAVFVEKTKIEKLALTLASIIAEKHVDDYSIYQLETLCQQKNDAWLLNWID